MPQKHPPARMARSFVEFVMGFSLRYSVGVTVPRRLSGHQARGSMAMSFPAPILMIQQNRLDANFTTLPGLIFIPASLLRPFGCSLASRVRVSTTRHAVTEDQIRHAHHYRIGGNIAVVIANRPGHAVVTRNRINVGSRPGIIHPVLTLMAITTKPARSNFNIDQWLTTAAGLIAEIHPPRSGSSCPGYLQRPHLRRPNRRGNDWRLRALTCDG